jgi:uncharacterized protein YyaL (SSP411 family)
MAESATVLERDDYREAARRCATFVLDRMRQPVPPAPAGTTGDPGGSPPVAERRLFRTYKDGRAKLNAYLEDYAFLADGLLALYESTFDPRWFAAAQDLAGVVVSRFADDAGGGFFDTSVDHERLVTRPKDLYDNATPAGSSVAADVLLRLAAYTGDGAMRERAERLLAGLSGAMTQAPGAFGRLLSALDFALGPTKEIALVGDPGAAAARDLLRVVFGPYRPDKVVALRRPGPDGDVAAQTIPLLAERVAVDGRPTAYVCEHFACQLPVTDAAALRAQLDAG